MSRFHVVVDLGFGDAGKGVFTDYLASTLRTPIVVRYNGGHQCGHTVTLPDGRSHVFSNFGSGTFRGVPTFFSKYCTIDPVGMLNEFTTLDENGFDPTLYVDAMAMVTTPYDKLWNQNNLINRTHGTVGVGFGATIERNLTPYKLHAMDLFHPEVLRIKLNAIREYYQQRKFKDEVDHDLFIGECVEASNLFEIEKEHNIINMSRFENIIFEGGQGVLLDMDFGFFPNVTRSYTTSRNAMEMISRNGNPTHLVNVYNLTRAYSTRHGYGPFPAGKHPVKLKNNKQETNVFNPYQRDFRTGILDVGMLQYAIECEWNYSHEATSILVVSCLDQLDEFKLQTDGAIDEYPDRDSFMRALMDGASFEDVYYNMSPLSNTIKKYPKPNHNNL